MTKFNRSYDNNNCLSSISYRKEPYTLLAITKDSRLIVEIIDILTDNTISVMTFHNKWLENLTENECKKILENIFLT